MRRTLLALLSTVTGLVMLLSFKTHSITTAAIATPAPSSAVSTPSPTPSSSLSSPTAPAATPGTTSVAVSKTVTGDAVDTRYGPVQVRITVTNGTITAAQAIDYPQSNGRDQEINSYAVPVLNQKAVKASSASIDTVSGATYTSNGYQASLQSALDKANA
jgi:uncharacterized protein with FMN-binding domain